MWLEDDDWSAPWRWDSQLFLLDKFILKLDWRVFWYLMQGNWGQLRKLTHFSFFPQGHMQLMAQGGWEHRWDSLLYRPRKILSWIVGWEEIHSCSCFLWKYCCRFLRKPASGSFFVLWRLPNQHKLLRLWNFSSIPQTKSAPREFSDQKEVEVH